MVRRVISQLHVHIMKGYVSICKVKAQVEMEAGTYIITFRQLILLLLGSYGTERYETVLTGWPTTVPFCRRTGVPLHPSSLTSRGS